MIDSSSFSDSPGRCRRTRQGASKTYVGEGVRSLELHDVLDVLSCYRDYEGGINCSTCGKLYKSKVCFIKHIWEHSVYWDQFAGERNHERVLGIQAALILYAGYSETDAERLMELLVTSPTDTTANTPAKKSCKKSATSKHAARHEKTPEKYFDAIDEDADDGSLCLSYPGSAAMWRRSFTARNNNLPTCSSVKEVEQLPDTCENNLRTPLTPRKDNQPQSVHKDLKVSKLDFNSRYPSTPAKRIPHPRVPITPKKRPRLQ